MKGVYSLKSSGQFQKGHIPWCKGKKGLWIGWGKGLKRPEFSGKSNPGWKGGVSTDKVYQNLRRKELRHKKGISKKYISISNIPCKSSTKEYWKEYREKYLIKNRDKIRLYRKKYKYLKKNSGKLEVSTIQQIYEDNIKQYGTLTCYLCEQPIIFGKDTLEHKIPLSRGGDNSYINLAIACEHCNKTKHNKTVEEYKQKGCKDGK